MWQESPVRVYSIDELAENLAENTGKLRLNGWVNVRLTQHGHPSSSACCISICCRHLQASAKRDAQTRPCLAGLYIQ